MNVNIKIDLIQNNIELDYDSEDICQIVNLYVTKDIDLKTFKFFVDIVDSKNNKIERYFPESHVNLMTTSLDIIHSFNYFFRPDESYKLKVRYDYENSTYQKEFDFVGVRPKKPYNSWLWDGDNWRAPVPYPTTNEEPLLNEIYQWDEDTISWIPIGGYTVE